MHIDNNKDLNITIPGNNITDTNSIIESNLSSKETKTQQNKVLDQYRVRIPQIPVLQAIDGIRFDFNNGLRVYLPENISKKYRIVIVDLDCGSVLFDCVCQHSGWVLSHNTYYTRFKLSIYDLENIQPIYQHQYNCKDKEVMVHIAVPVIGDTIAWFTYVQKFQKKHGCKLICVMVQKMIQIFRQQYPNITFVTCQQAEQYKPYACYVIAIFGGQQKYNHLQIDYRLTGLHKLGAYILGVDLQEEAPRVNLSAKRVIKQKYVCIAAQGSSLLKCWNNPQGWISVIKFLKDNGYRVLCIDKSRYTGYNISWNILPHGAEDFTGDLPLQERINLIKDADFFIGTSSGLSWIAWCCKVPVVLISGFTNPITQFYTPYRVINYHTCNSCWNDSAFQFDNGDPAWCPRHKNTDRQFQCSRLISAEHIINIIKTIPSFKEKTKKQKKEPGKYERFNLCWRKRNQTSSSN